MRISIPVFIIVYVYCIQGILHGGNRDNVVESIKTIFVDEGVDGWSLNDHDDVIRRRRRRMESKGSEIVKPLGDRTEDKTIRSSTNSDKDQSFSFNGLRLPLIKKRRELNNNAETLENSLSTSIISSNNNNNNNNIQESQQTENKGEEEEEENEFILKEKELNEAKPFLLKTHQEMEETIDNGNSDRDYSDILSHNPMSVDTTYGDDNCVAWEDQPYQPPSDKARIVSPFVDGDKRSCKVYSRFSSTWYVCTASLVSSNIIILSRHCTFNRCEGGREPDETMVRCGYSFFPSELPNIQYDHYGTAVIKYCLAYKSYDDSAQCVNFKEVSNADYDIQLCILDRPVGNAIGWFGAALEAPSTVKIFGYPGDSDLINYYGSNINNQCFLHEESVSTATDRYLKLNGAFIWAGESGSGYLNEKILVTAVHRGGPTGCEEQGVRWTTELFTTLKCLKGEQIDDCKQAALPNPGAYCELVAHPFDLFKLFGVTRLFSVGNNQFQVSLRVGLTFKATVAIFNPGNVATNATLTWWVSLNSFISSADITIGQQTVLINPNTVKYITSPSFSVQWSGARYIGATWKSNCATRVENHVPSGIVNGILCASKCTVDMLANEVCDPECNFETCKWDNQRCLTTPTTKTPSTQTTIYPTPGNTDGNGGNNSTSCSYTNKPDCLNDPDCGWISKGRKKKCKALVSDPVDNKPCSSFTRKTKCKKQLRCMWESLTGTCMPVS